MTLKHLKAELAFYLMHLPMKGQHRTIFAKAGGVSIDNQAFIGSSVTFDTVYPERIHIGKHVHITSGCVILTHYLDTTKDGIHWQSGDVFIGDNSFIGTGTIICKDVRIGKNVIVGAGSVITKDIPDNEIWAGNPARLIRKR